VFHYSFGVSIERQQTVVWPACYDFSWDKSGYIAFNITTSRLKKNCYVIIIIYNHLLFQVIPTVRGKYYFLKYVLLVGIFKYRIDRREYLISLNLKKSRIEIYNLRNFLRNDLFTKFIKKS